MRHTIHILANFILFIAFYYNTIQYYHVHEKILGHWITHRHCVVWLSYANIKHIFIIRYGSR